MFKELFNIYVFVMLLTGERVLADSMVGYEYLSDVGGWLHLHTVPASWRDARLQCLLEGGSLASPTTSALVEAMKKKMKDHQIALNAVFTDINATVYRNDFLSINGVPLLNISLEWTNGEPNNFNNNENCLVMAGDGTVADDDCASVYPYFCYRERSNCGTTDPDYVLEPRTGSCYKFHSAPKIWRHSATMCTAERAYLAVINSDTESQVLKELLNKHPCKSMVTMSNCNASHIGIRLEDGVWLTINGETLEQAGFGKWAKYEPNNEGGNEFCGSMTREGLLNDVPCGRYEKSFICEIIP